MEKNVYNTLLIFWTKGFVNKYLWSTYIHKHNKILRDIAVKKNKQRRQYRVDDKKNQTW